LVDVLLHFTAVLLDGSLKFFPTLDSGYSFPMSARSLLGAVLATACSDGFDQKMVINARQSACDWGHAIAAR
jgi:hypothetical protein